MKFINYPGKQVFLGLASAMLAGNFTASTTQTNAATPPVLIVGVGLAGLVAGYRFTQVGVTVNIIEARNRVGGRLQTKLKALGTNMPLELGGEFIDSNHTALRKLAKELGVQEVDLNGKTNNLNLNLHSAGIFIFKIICQVFNIALKFSCNKTLNK